MSRIAETRRRARRTKTALVAVAVAAFALMGVAVRAAHPGAGASGSSSGTTQLAPPNDLVTAFNESGEDDGFSAGSIAPAQGPPSASTSTS